MSVTLKNLRHIWEDNDGLIPLAIILTDDGVNVLCENPKRNLRGTLWYLNVYTSQKGKNSWGCELRCDIDNLRDIITTLESKTKNKIHFFKINS